MKHVVISDIKIKEIDFGQHMRTYIRVILSYIVIDMAYDI